ncbi:MAG TPA: b(o/a)3-type cytochrome-c oxidase subunit 1 [Methylococcus sp.]|nr:b(o/a)3-type cytochrome-c oxidase subunit 1 [Methylococcus sp.]
MSEKAAQRFVLQHFWVAFGAFGVASLLGFYQVMERSGIVPALQSPAVYFASVSTHGVLMAYVLTTFFIMGFSYYVAVTSLGLPIRHWMLARVGFGVALLGTVLAAIPLLLGKASVLYTFYPPVQASFWFYLGATLLVVGSWFWVAVMLLMFAGWKRTRPGENVPLPMFATAANAILWLWTSIGVALEAVFQLLPWSLGLVDTIDVGLARTLFSWTLHPIVYFWLIPAYLALYVFVPPAAGGKLFSEQAARVALVMIMVFGLPIGFHHLYVDPEQGAGWKLAHGVGTFAVAIPTLLTAFTVTASLEMAGRAAGGKGLFGWIGALPWSNPMVLAAILSLLMLVLGGFGGLINASYAMNTMVHNTAWVSGHFHLIFAGTVVTMYFAIAYHLWPRLTGKTLYSESYAALQLWAWFIGMVILTTPWHVLGLLGQPRRISSVTYNTLLTLAWDPYELAMVVGGLILLLSAGLFLFNLAKTQLAGSVAGETQVVYAEPLHPVGPLPDLLNGFKWWNVVILFLMLASFGYPIARFFLMETHNPTAWGY